MSIIEIILISIGLAMDAFAVSICKGLSVRQLKIKYALTIALFFGLFQAIMPLIGYVLSSQFAKYITSFDHWIAFILLLFIGAKMIKESFDQKSDCTYNQSGKIEYKELLILSVATSIDALAVGITFALVENSNIFLSVSCIGIITFIISFVGVYIGNKFGDHFEKKAEMLGGIILILIGIKILLEHLGVF